MLNIASANMLKIKPETKVLIIKTLKSTAEVDLGFIKGNCALAGVRTVL